ncbi:hypothetical protein [Streptococcus dysgalactiae]|uniref:hypothetical protein n=1 Tax=Streptococcus dysgalactiae TaxID=1334 RepID=UPI0034A0ED64
MKKMTLLTFSAISLLILSACSTSKIEEKPSNAKTNQQPKIEKGNEPAKKVNYDVADMNVKITDSFNESVQFNKDGADGYEWTTYISELKLNDNGAIHTTVTDDFLLLDEAQKTEVLNHVSSSVNMVVFIETSEDKPYFITAFDVNNNKVAQSKVTKVTEYKFY